jgi:hypothetical protein
LAIKPLFLRIYEMDLGRRLSGVVQVGEEEIDADAIDEVVGLNFTFW